MAKAVRIVPILNKAPTTKTLTSNIGIHGTSYSSFGTYSWYSQIVQSAHARLSRYNDYDVMDEDGDVSRALDLIADEMVGSVADGSSTNLVLDILDIDMAPTTAEVLNMALTIWVDTIGLKTKLFDIARQTVKYGDCFFIRSHHNSKWTWIPPRRVVACDVDARDGTSPLAWHLRTDGESIYQHVVGGGLYTLSGATGSNNTQVMLAPTANIVRFTTRPDITDVAPFGESVLKAAVIAFKQKTLIEQAAIIYRVVRAPERRVFYVDVGNAPLPIRAQLLDQIKNEIKQKKVPRQVPNTQDPFGQNATVDKVFDPMSTNEDYFFPVSTDARGSKVETLPGGANVGEVSDLELWRRMLWRALKIPHSYLDDGNDNQQPFNDGKTGTAYIQELKFNTMIQRLQQPLNAVFDAEFKQYLRDNDIIIDNSYFQIKLPTPQNFATYRQQALDNDLLSNYQQADQVGHFAKRFALERFMMFTNQEIIDNERSLREEYGLDPDDSTIPTHMLYNEAIREFLSKRMIKHVSAILDTRDDMDQGMGTDDDFGADFGDSLATDGMFGGTNASVGEMGGLEGDAGSIGHLGGMSMENEPMGSEYSPNSTSPNNELS